MKTLKQVKEAIKKRPSTADAMKAFLAKGGKIKKLPPGKAAGYHGKDDPGKDMHGMMAKGDTKAIGTRKKVKSMESVDELSMYTSKKVPNLSYPKKKTKYEKEKARLDMMKKNKQKGESVEEAIKHTHAVVDGSGKVAGMTSNEKDAKDIARRHKGKVIKLKKPMSPKKGDMMINRPFKESVKEEIDEDYQDGDYQIPCSNPGCNCDPCTCGPSCKCGNIVNEADEKDPGEYDEEGLMMKDQLDIVMDAADEIYDMVEDNENLPEWCQNKITKSADYIDSVRDYLMSQKKDKSDD